MKKYRIGIDARLFGTGQAAGIGTYAEELIGNLLKLDRDNLYTIFATPEVADLFPFYAPNLTKQAVVYPHYSLAEQLFYPTQLAKARLHLVHYTNFNSPIFFHRAKSVVTIHDLTLWFFSGRKKRGKLFQAAYKYVIRKTCENAERIIAVSQGTKKDIVEHLGIPEEKIDVIYEAVPARLQQEPTLKRIEMVKAKYNLTRPYFLYVGQWRSHKNLVRLIRAFALARRNYDLDYQLVLVGKPDPLAPEVPETIKQLGLQDRVVVTGYVADSDLSLFYKGAMAFVFPSLYEGFGLPPLEAMACGTPVISSNASVMPEILGDAALYFDPESVEDIAAKLHQFASGYHLQHQLKGKLANQVAKYSFAKMAKETLAVYKKILSPEPPSR
jgi:glycosyltransferase involved in cell wall biosynthesis